MAQEACGVHDPTTINVLVSSFGGLGLPPTLSLPLTADRTIKDLTETLRNRLPATCHNLILTTNSNKVVRPSSLPITILLPSHDTTLLPLRLSVPLCGGKGGFGSQLRAAGGRMSSRKKQAENTGSNRNLDGRRLRTVKEAKALAEYLAVKPEMDRKEKEERRKRWEQVVEAAERREEEIKSGKGKGRVDEQWVEQKEKAESSTREDILKALRAGDIQNVLGNVGESSSENSAEDDSEREDDIAAKPSRPVAESLGRKFFGWDDDEEDEDENMSDEEIGPADPSDTKGKGKATV